MQDVLYAAIVAVAFAAFWGLIRLCDRIVGSEQEVSR